MGSLYLWGHSIQEMGGDVVIGRSIYGVVVIDGLLCSRFYGSSHMHGVHSLAFVHKPLSPPVFGYF